MLGIELNVITDEVELAPTVPVAMDSKSLAAAAAVLESKIPSINPIYDMPPTTYQLFVPTLMQDAALKAVVMVGLVDTAPALAIVTPEPCTTVQVPLAPILIIFMTDPLVKATELSGGIVIVVALVLA